MKDGDGKTVRAGDAIRFSYGIPPVPVIAQVFKSGGRLYAYAHGHTPGCRLDLLRGYVGEFWKVKKEVGK